jgi:5-methylcytosine-specific restriction protein B
MAENIVQDFPNLPYQKNTAETLVYPKNLILYGPPGTGKTYQTVNLALGIIEGKTLKELANEARTDLVRRFHQYQQNLQIEVVSFHANYSYEDFVQGLRPNTQAGTLLFEKKDGVFKRLADRAKRNWDAFTQKPSKVKRPFEELLNIVLSKNIDPETEEIEFLLEKNHRIYKSIIVFDITEDALIYRRRTKNEIIKNEDRKLYFNKLADLYEGKSIQEAINEKYYQAVIEVIKNQHWQFNEAEENLELKNYVLILDEINRANLSRVFGELITLIEEDKRYGAENSLTLTLPSGDILAVPKNLYLIGTMNTADKSIATLDLALRRRFQFEPMYPNENLISNLRLRLLLQKLNQALWEEKKSGDYLIGHTFLLGKSEKDLAQVFEKQLFPLLQEFFPQREDKVKKILHTAGVEIKEEAYQWKFVKLK